jgi:hypothetical protein
VTRALALAVALFSACDFKQAFSDYCGTTGNCDAGQGGGSASAGGGTATGGGAAMGGGTDSVGGGTAAGGGVASGGGSAAGGGAADGGGTGAVGGGIAVGGGTGTGCDAMDTVDSTLQDGTARDVNACQTGVFSAFSAPATHDMSCDQSVTVIAPPTITFYGDSSQCNSQSLVMNMGVLTFGFEIHAFGAIPYSFQIDGVQIAPLTRQVTGRATMTVPDAGQLKRNMCNEVVVKASAPAASDYQVDVQFPGSVLNGCPDAGVHTFVAGSDTLILGLLPMTTGPVTLSIDGGSALYDFSVGLYAQ